MTDESLLRTSLEQLQATGQIEYTGEFGAEITTFIPFIGWLKREGLLQGRRVVTYGGMRPYYFFVDDDEYAEKPGKRRWLPPEERTWPSNTTYAASLQRWHAPPDYRARYVGQGRTFKRPVLFIQNKFTVEWERGPINFISLKHLEALCALSEKGQFDVVYSRPRTQSPSADYTDDENTHCEYPDLSVVRRYPQVLILEDYCADSGAPYNLTKLEILAKSRVCVAVQGGGAHLLACFGSSLMLLLHLVGDEYPQAYTTGPYKYLASPPPVLLVATSFIRMDQGVGLIENVRVEGASFHIDSAHGSAFKALRM
jgi:hypothetical protein